VAPHVSRISLQGISVMDDPKEPPPMVFGELSQPLPGRRLSNAGPTGPVYVPEDPGGHNGTTGPNGPLTLRANIQGAAAVGHPRQIGLLDEAPTLGGVEVELEGVFAEGHAAGAATASAAGAAVSAGVGTAGVIRTGPDTVYPPVVTISAETNVRADAIVVKGPASVGRMVIANRNAILVQAMSAELLLRDVIDREKEARRNTGSAPELEAILAKVHDVRAMLAAAPSEPEIGATALLLKKCVLDWFDKDHVSILNLGYKSGLFVLLMGLIVYFGLIPATIAATLLSKDVGEALKQLVKLLKGD
jgi:hypothetical protein